MYIADGEVFCRDYVGMPVTDTLLNAGKVALFGTGREACTDWIEIDVNHTGGNGCVIEQIGALKA